MFYHNAVPVFMETRNLSGVLVSDSANGWTTASSSFGYWVALRRASTVLSPLACGYLSNPGLWLSYLSIESDGVDWRIVSVLFKRGVVIGWTSAGFIAGSPWVPVIRHIRMSHSSLSQIRNGFSIGIRLHDRSPVACGLFIPLFRGSSLGSRSSFNVTSILKAPG